MYKKNLFVRGAKSFLTYKHKRGGSCCGSGCGSYGSGSNMDDYLLGMVRNVSIHSKPKKKPSRGGAGLKFVRYCNFKYFSSILSFSFVLLLNRLKNCLNATSLFDLSHKNLMNANA